MQKLTKSRHVVAGVSNDEILKLTALFHDIGKPYAKKKVDGKVNYLDHEVFSEILAKLVLNRLGYEDAIVKSVCCLIKIHDKKIDPTIETIKLVIADVGKDNFERLLILQTSDINAHAKGYAELIIPRLDKLKEVYKQLKDII